MSILTNVLKDGTAAHPTPIVLTLKAHTDATVTAVITNLETLVIVSLPLNLVTFVAICFTTEFTAGQP